jgi:hypothetical protein
MEQLPGNKVTKQSAAGVPSIVKGSLEITTDSCGALVTWIATLSSQ